MTQDSFSGVSKAALNKIIFVSESIRYLVDEANLCL